MLYTYNQFLRWFDGVRYYITLERAIAMLRKNNTNASSVAHTIVENPPNHEKNREPNYFGQMTEERTVNQWYFVTKIDLTYCEKKLFQWPRKTFEIRCWRLRICKIFEITRTIHSNSRLDQLDSGSSLVSVIWTLHFVISCEIENRQLRKKETYNGLFLFLLRVFPQ